MRPRLTAATYSAAHMRVRRDRGSAALHTCPCGRPAREWAYLHNDPGELVEARMAYSLDPSNYAAKCVSCHRRSDSGPCCPHGHEYTPENTIQTSEGRKCRTCVQARDRERWKRRPPLTDEQKRRKEVARLARRAARREASS